MIIITVFFLKWEVLSIVISDFLVLLKTNSSENRSTGVIRPYLLFIRIFFGIPNNSKFNERSWDNKFSNISSIIVQFININSQKRGDIVVDVISADELSDKQINQIKNQLKSVLGEKLSLNFNVDKKIIGGLIVKVGSKMIDSSLASKINKMRIAMKGA